MLQHETYGNIFLTDEERQPCEIYTRVMGYIRPISEFNKGKQGEYLERVCFKEDPVVAK
jgi:Anaerobic ribonucleoside-triphosphate reductase